MQDARFTGAKRLREMLNDPSRIIIAPGVYDGLTARIALAQGFDCLYMTGAGTSMSRLGWADLGLATHNDMAANAAMIASLSPSTPVIADADTGYGGPLMVTRTVQAYARAGVAALHLEDQVQEKRCGHLLGKQLVERDVFYARISAAAKARDAMGSDMLIIARTDARAGEGDGFKEAVERLKGARECGADVLFLEALTSKEEANEACEALKPTPLLLNMVPGGKTPNMSAEEARNCGFRIVIFPLVCIEAVLKEAEKGLKALKDTGKVDDGEAKGVREAFMLCGLQEAIDVDKEAGGKAYENV